MSDKLVRDELLRSHRFQKLSGDTPKLLFLVLLLTSDHFSNAEYNTTVISAAMGRPLTEEAIATLLSELFERDLVRPYTVGDAQYVHIPRSRQRIRYLHGKHPRPPASLEDKSFKELAAKVGLKSDSSQTQVGRREEKRSEENQGTEKPAKVDKSVDKSPGKWWDTVETIRQKAYSLGLKDNPGETRDSLYRRVRAQLDAAKEKP